jgi:hypothetical protein
MTAEHSRLEEARTRKIPWKGRTVSHPFALQGVLDLSHISPPPNSRVYA